jgi:flagellar biosynthesis protein FlhF
MKVKRYLAPDMRRAIAQIREEMGVEAVILSNRTVEGGVEVVAAAMPEDISFSSTGSLRPTAAKPSESPSKSAASVAKPAPAKPSAGPRAEPKGARAAQQLQDFERLQREAEHNASTPFLNTQKDQQMQTNKPAAEQEVAALLRAEQAVLRAEQEQRAQREHSIAESREMNRMRSELNGIRRLLEQRLSGMAWEQFARRTPIQASVWERLNAMGVPASLSKSLLDKLKPSMTTAEAWRFAIASLARQVPVAGTDVAAKGGVFALLGPTGVGKTTTIGKLATRYVLEHGPEAVALVTTDSFRVAAHEQLRTFGRILGVTVRVVDEGHSLRQILESLRHKSLVLIDTAGLHAKDPSLQFQLQTLRNSPEVQNLLVMSCTNQASVLANALRTYAPAGLSGCILSKLDEAGVMGEALALAIESALPVVYETHGQNIPDDIKVAQAHNLVSKAVALSVHSEEESERLMYEFGSVYGDEMSAFDQEAPYQGVAQGVAR